MDAQATPKLITIASRRPGFAWAGRQWDTEPEVVRIGDDAGELEEADESEANGAFRITPAQYAELQRQCAYPLYPLRIGRADGAAQAIADGRRELAEVRTTIESERRALEELKAERQKTDKLLGKARKRLADVEKELAQAQDALAAAEARASAAEVKASDVQVEDKPDPNRERN